MGPAYERAMLREIHFMLQVINYTLGAVNTDKGKENPIPEPQYLPKPTDFEQDDDDKE